MVNKGTCTRWMLLVLCLLNASVFLGSAHKSITSRNEYELRLNKDIHSSPQSAMIESVDRLRPDKFQVQNIAAFLPRRLLISAQFRKDSLPDDRYEDMIQGRSFKATVYRRLALEESTQYGRRKVSSTSQGLTATVMQNPLMPPQNVTTSQTLVNTKSTSSSGAANMRTEESVFHVDYEGPGTHPGHIH